MQQLWLKNFEFNINPATWNVAQDLVQAGAVKNLREVERHFWVALVEGQEGGFETEMMITPQKIKAFTCECFAEGRRLMCPHVAASLLKIRQFLEQQAEARKEKQARKESRELSRLTVQTALQHATPEALEAFVRVYARKDRDFALALKTWFAAAVDVSENPFALILRSVVPRVSQKQPLREPEFRRLRKTLDDLTGQLENARAELNHRVSYQISAALLGELLPLAAGLDEARQEQLLPLCRQAMQALHELDQAGISPELRDLSRQTVYNLGSKGLYFKELLREALRSIGPGTAENSRFEQIRNEFDQTPYPAPPFVLQLFLIALIHRDMPVEALCRVLDDYREAPQRIRETILQLYYLKYWDAAAGLIEHFSPVFGGAQKREMDDVLFFISEQNGDKTRIIRILQQRFLQNGQFEYFHKLKKAAGEAWPGVLAQISAALKTKQDNKTLAAVLAAEDDRAGLSALLADQKDITTLQRYEDILLPRDRSFVRVRYTELLSEYLSEHFGKQAAGFVRDRLAGLVAKGAGDLAREIIADLTERFDERASLAEELMELFPKNKRPPSSLSN